MTPVTEYETVVYDLDGTLVHLAVDWDAVAHEAGEILDSLGTTPGADLWSMLDQAADIGEHDAVESVIADHECQGAVGSTPGPAIDELPLDVPVGVCSLNCERACRIALAQHEIEQWIGCVVGRDSLEVSKPDPEPLLTVIRTLGGTPERTLFVGDSERDELTAQRAGTDYRYI